MKKIIYKTKCGPCNRDYQKNLLKKKINCKKKKKIQKFFSYFILPLCERVRTKKIFFFFFFQKC